MKEFGSIYMITDHTNNKRYIGQTSRDIDIRLDEHICDDKTSNLHKAIEEHGWRNFSVEEIESVPLNELDIREKYWIEYYNTNIDGYNMSPSGIIIESEQERLYVPKKNIYINTVEYFADICARTVLWNKNITIKNVKIALTTGNKYLGYSFELKRVAESDCVSEDVLVDWIKTLKKTNDSKFIYSPELDKIFLTPNEATLYCLNNGLYKPKSKYPEYELKGLIVKMLSNRLKNIPGMEELHFIERYGSNKES